MDSYLVVTYNAGSDVAYPEGDFPSQESAVEAAQALREEYPLGSKTVREGFLTSITVVLTDGVAFSPRLFHC